MREREGFRVPTAIGPPEDKAGEARPAEEGSSQAEMTAAGGDGRRISTVLIIIGTELGFGSPPPLSLSRYVIWLPDLIFLRLVAMQTEALPLVNKFQLSEDTDGSL